MLISIETNALGKIKDNGKVKCLATVRLHAEMSMRQNIGKVLITLEWKIRSEVEFVLEKPKQVSVKKMFNSNKKYASIIKFTNYLKHKNCIPSNITFF